MAYSYKTGEVDRFDYDIIATGSRRRANEAAQSKMDNPEISARRIKPRSVSSAGEYTTRDSRISNARKIDRIYSNPPRKTALRNEEPRSAARNVRPMTRAEEMDLRNVKMNSAPIPVSKSVPANHARTKPNSRSIDAAPPVRRTRLDPPAKVKAEPKARIITKKDKNKKPFPLATLFGSVMITLMLLYVVVLYIQVDEYADRLADLKDTLASRREYETVLKVKIEGKYNLDEIEKIATGEYGMVNADQLPKKYVSIAGDDVVQIMDDENDEGDLGVMMSGIVSAIGDLFGIK